VDFPFFSGRATLTTGLVTATEITRLDQSNKTFPFSWVAQRSPKGWQRQQKYKGWTKVTRLSLFLGSRSAHHRAGNCTTIKGLDQSNKLLFVYHQLPVSPENLHIKNGIPKFWRQNTQAGTFLHTVPHLFSFV
jgi:hypothetical protein